ncbi:transporter substrate-binding domain-containing protein [Aureimonas ureilytica]|uniref:transporter substrate-binding domain-containing protein n=1 Tax=Aureimonas ureilytica TaxID=401562 RepID=UPI000AB0A38F
MRLKKPTQKRTLTNLAALCLSLVAFWAVSPAQAQSAVETPNFRDQTLRITQPDLSARTRIRFLTAVDYPPFNFLDQRGRLTGFHVDLARAICEELNVTAICQIEARPFADLGAALESGEGDAVVAGLAISADNRARFAFTQPFFRYPARFMVRRGTDLTQPLQGGLVGVDVGVVTGSAHEAMLRSFFPKAKPVPFDTLANAQEALRAGRVKALFGDGVASSFWLGSEASADCCEFAGGPYLSDRFLGEGLGIAVRGDDPQLASAFDYAIGRIVRDGRMSELLLRYFPISAF